MSASTDNPIAWAAGKRSKVESYARGSSRAVGDTVRAALPIIAPGSFVCAWLGVSANGGTTENTTGWVTGSASERAAAVTAGRTPIRLGSAVYRADDASSWSNRGFHELGAFGVEGGPARGPAPAGDSAWSQGAAAADVVAVLGRRGNTTPGGWMGPRGIPDQVAIGMWGNRRHALGVNRTLGGASFAVTAEGEPVRWTQWVFALSAMAWSAGDAGAARHLAPYLVELAAVPEPARFSRWTELLVARGRPGAPKSHANAFYSCLRTWQKLAAGEVARAFTGEGEDARAFLAFTGSDREATFARLTAGGVGGSSGGGSSSSSSGSGSASSSGSSGSSGGAGGVRAFASRHWRHGVMLLGATAATAGVVVGGRALVRRFAVDGSEVM